MLVYTGMLTLHLKVIARNKIVHFKLFNQQTFSGPSMVVFVMILVYGMIYAVCVAQKWLCFAIVI